MWTAFHVPTTVFRGSLDRDNARISLYDTTPGGSGHSEQVFEWYVTAALCSRTVPSTSSHLTLWNIHSVEELWERALDVVSQCPCEHGCNTCIFLSGCAEYNAVSQEHMNMHLFSLGNGFAGSMQAWCNCAIAIPFCNYP